MPYEVLGVEVFVVFVDAAVDAVCRSVPGPPRPGDLVRVRWGSRRSQLWSPKTPFMSGFSLSWAFAISRFLHVPLYLEHDRSCTIVFPTTVVPK